MNKQEPMVSRVAFFLGLMALGALTLLFSQVWTSMSLLESGLIISTASSLSSSSASATDTLTDTDAHTRPSKPANNITRDESTSNSHSHSLTHNNKELMSLLTKEAFTKVGISGSSTSASGSSNSIYVYQVVHRPYIEAWKLPYKIVDVSLLNNFYLVKHDVRYNYGDLVVGFNNIKNNEFGEWTQIGSDMWLPTAMSSIQNNGTGSLTKTITTLKYIKQLKVPESIFYYNELMLPEDCDEKFDDSDTSDPNHDNNVFLCNMEKQLKKEVLRLVDFTRLTTANTNLKEDMPKKAKKGSFNFGDFTKPLWDIFGTGEETSSNEVDDDPDLTDEVKQRKRNCAEAKSWLKCTKYGYCAWRKLPNKEFCFLDDDFELPTDLTLEEYDPKYDFSDDDPGAENAEELLEYIDSLSPEEELDMFYENLAVAFQNIENGVDVDSNGDDPKQVQIQKNYSAYVGKKYFVYQPSGGMNNQKKQLENALVICKLLNRTCVIPPAAPHTNFFENYNRQPDSKLTTQQRLLNAQKISEIVDVSFLPQGETLVRFVNANIAKYNITSWRMVNKDYKRVKVVKKWSEKSIIERFGGMKKKFLFFCNHSMWASLEWKGSMGGFLEKKIIQDNLIYNNVLKRVATTLSYQLALLNRNHLLGYNSIHIRRGDKKGEANFYLVSHDPVWYIERLSPYLSETKILYIATDEKDRDYFKEFSAAGFQTVFWENLDRNTLLPYLSRFPARMFMDILSMIEQMICAYSSKFLGSGYSTLSVYVLRLRRHRTEIAYDTELGPLKGLPIFAQNNTDCNPMKAKDHASPC